MATKDDLETQLEKARKDVEVLARMAGDRAGTLAGQARGEIDAYVATLSDEARAMFDDAKSRGREVRAVAEDQVREHPLAAVGVALFAGFVLASIMRR